ncbi:MAG: VCBS repeat-containing protein [Cyanobacteria bacterium]|nr:VCBS repeat-containing protein [Cyanobacteriota bacterium]
MTKPKSIKLLALLIYCFVFIQSPVVAGCGTFTESTLKSSLGDPFGVTAGDYDGDGDIDIAVAEASLDKIVWYENDGSEGFATAHNVKTSYSDPMMLVTYDVNQDGYLDLVSSQDPTASGDNDDVIVFVNNGDGSVWTEYLVVGTVNSCKAIDLADIDNDGDIDVVVADSQDDNVMWYKNDGSEGFTEQTVITAFDAAIGVQLGDINSDGEMDVSVSSQGTSQDIIWYENDGSENFSANAHTIDSTYSGQYHDLVDLDGDGDLDLIIASHAGDLLSWYKNNGNETFTDMGDIASGSTDLDEANMPHAGDLDNDGDIDIVLGAWASNKFMWFANDGSESFTKTVLKTTTDARESFLVDLDGDGYIDIIQAGGANDDVIWYQSDCTNAGPAQLFFVP